MIEESFIESLLLSEGDILRKAMALGSVRANPELLGLLSEAAKFHDAATQRLSSWFSVANESRKKRDHLDDEWLVERRKYITMVDQGMTPEEIYSQMMRYNKDPVYVIRGLRDLFDMPLDRALQVVTKPSR